MPNHIRATSQKGQAPPFQNIITTISLWGPACPGSDRKSRVGSHTGGGVAPSVLPRGDREPAVPQANDPAARGIAGGPWRYAAPADGPPQQGLNEMAQPQVASGRCTPAWPKDAQGSASGSSG